ncbi:MAG: thioesterase, partial [Planctomycetota bacterium]
MRIRFLLLLAVIGGLCGNSVAANGPATRKIVLIAGPKSHGPTGNGIHDYPWSVKLLKVMLDHSNVREQVRVEYHLDGMPRDLKTLDDADSIMVISDGRDGDLYQEAPHFGSEENLKAVQKQIDRGCGFLTFHFSTFAPDQYAKQILDWSGGYFDWETDGKKKWYSAITHKEADVELRSPGHPVLRGVKPFKMKEEFYFNLRFAEDGAKSNGLSPLFVVPALNGREPDGNVVAWAKQRADGGRGFGTTCGHFYANWEREEFRKLILNAITWTAKLDVPANGVEARYFTHAEITKALAGIEGTARAVIDDQPIRVLLIAGNDAHKWHNWEKTTPAMKAALERD